MTRDELKAEVEKVRKVQEQTRSDAYCYAHGKDGLVEVRVDAKGTARVTPVDDQGRPIGDSRRVRAWTSA